jgi:hypothetical protein
MVGTIRLFLPVVLEDGIADSNTLVTDVGARVVAGRRNQLTDGVLRLMTKGTAKGIVGTCTLHKESPS